MSREERRRGTPPEGLVESRSLDELGVCERYPCEGRDHVAIGSRDRCIASETHAVIVIEIRFEIVVMSVGCRFQQVR